MSEPLRIAVLEDEAEIARLYATILEDEGHDAWHVDQHDLEAIGDAEVVIVDLMMPDVDGVAVLDWLDANKPDVRVVVASAMYAIPDSVRDRADVLLPKPFSPSQLTDAIA